MLVPVLLKLLKPQLSPLLSESHHIVEMSTDERPPVNIRKTHGTGFGVLYAIELLEFVQEVCNGYMNVGEFLQHLVVIKILPDTNDLKLGVNMTESILLVGANYN